MARRNRQDDDPGRSEVVRTTKMADMRATSGCLQVENRKMTDSREESRGSRSQRDEGEKQAGAITNHL